MELLKKIGLLILIVIITTFLFKNILLFFLILIIGGYGVYWWEKKERREAEAIYEHKKREEKELIRIKLKSEGKLKGLSEQEIKKLVDRKWEEEWKQKIEHTNYLDLLETERYLKKMEKINIDPLSDELKESAIRANKAKAEYYEGLNVNRKLRSWRK